MSHNHILIAHSHAFIFSGDSATTETMVRRVLDRAYGPDFFAGDEDNGEQGAWFVLSALGLYSVAPGEFRRLASPYPLISFPFSNTST